MFKQQLARQHVVSFPGIKRAVAELGCPDVVWFRGHSGDHKLWPWLFRFPGAVERELALFKQFRRLGTGRNPGAAESGIRALIEMHNSYLPGRLLAWTQALKVALFCAIAREVGPPVIFVLDPLKMNMLSQIDGILSVGSPNVNPHYFSDWPQGSSVPEFAIAIDARTALHKGASSDAIFTVHGTDIRPIEQQCPDCVRRVILTETEQAAAMQHILSELDVSIGHYRERAHDVP